jgi:hypothetical protein
MKFRAVLACPRQLPSNSSNETTQEIGVFSDNFRKQKDSKGLRRVDETRLYEDHFANIPSVKAGKFLGVGPKAQKKSVAGEHKSEACESL